MISSPLSGTGNASWTSRDRATLMRIESALIDAGLPIETESADTDGGDPWTVFSRRQSGDVLIHVSLADGVYTIASELTGVLLQGPSFEAIARRFLLREPAFILEASHPGAIIAHPGSALISIFAAICVMAEDMELVACGERADRMGPNVTSNAMVHIAENAHLSIGRYTFDRQQTSAIMAAVSFFATDNSTAQAAEVVDLDAIGATASLGGVSISFGATDATGIAMLSVGNDDHYAVTTTVA